MQNEVRNVPHMDDRARLRALLDSAVDGIITIDERGTIEAANPAAERLFGYAVTEMVGRNVNMLMPSPFAQEHDAYLSNYLRTGQKKIIGVGREVTGRRKDGSVFPLYLAVSEVSFGHRRVFTGFVHDLTQVRKAEQHATQLGRILENSLNEIYVFDAATLQFLLVNRGARENTGYTAEEMSQLTPVDIKPQFTLAAFREVLKPLVAGELSEVQLDAVHQRRDGSTYDVNVRLQKTIWEEHEAFVAIIRDVTQEKRIRSELRQRDAQLEFMVEHLPAAAAYVDISTGSVRFNQVVQQITGYTADQLSTLDDCFRRLFADRAAVIRKLYFENRIAWDHQPFRLEVRRSDGVDRIVEFCGYRYDHHEVWLLQDVTERDRHETALRIRDQAIQAANEGVVIADAVQEGHPIVFVNHAFENMSGFSAAEVIGGGCDVLCGHDPNDPSLQKLREAMQNRQEFRTTVQCSHKSGRLFWNEISIAPVRSIDGKVTHVVAVMEDVSERRDSQQQLLQAERLAAIGQMVTGLAHESRNALQRAQACLDMLALDLEDQPEQLELTAKTHRALTDLHRYYEEVRNYAAPIVLEYRKCDLSKLWRTTWRDLESIRSGRQIELIEMTGGADLTCSVDPHRMEQVFRNIMENSVAACSDPGQLTIRCEKAVLDDRDCLRISFRDNGPGIHAAAATQVFQPFFTTKQKGTGLGMAIAKRIVDAHGGQIELGTTTNPGAEIIVILPR